jgi:type II secretion system protein D
VTVNGFAYTRRGRVIRVTMPGAAEKERPTTQVFTVRHANATQLVSPLRTALSTAGAIEADGRSNSLVITDIPTSLQMVAQVLNTLDVPTPQVLIETKIIETVLSDEERLGINWNLAASLQGAARPTTFPFPQTGDPFLRRFRPTGQTASESTTTTTATGATATATATDFPSAQQGLFFPFAERGLFTFGTLSFNQFQVVLQALQTRGETKALAAPSIATLDNEEAQIVIGSNVPVPTFTQNKQTGDFQITGYDNMKTGVVLRVTPHVTQDRRILLDIHPQVSDVTRFVGDPRAQVPVTSTREADTRVEVKDGETVVIGGLIDEKDVVTRREVPLLGKIPYLGRLFRFNEKTKGRTDLLIFITAHILTDEQRAYRTLEAIGTMGRPDLFGFTSKPLKLRSMSPLGPLAKDPEGKKEEGQGGP